MKRVRFRDPGGAVRTGAWEEDGVSFGGVSYDMSEVDVLPPTDPSKIVCVGLNYLDHIGDNEREEPEDLRLFVKTPNVLAGHGDTVTLPPDKELIEHEGELGVVVAEQCRNVAPQDALDVVAGYTCLDDLSNRDDQLATENNVRAKCFDGALPAGPVVAPPEDVPTDAALRTLVNGEVRQETTIDRMIYGVPEIVAGVTEFMTLEPGDVIATGTPAGNTNLADGDRVEVEIEGVGTLTHWVDRPA